ncbi:MAG: hypothetical protein CMI63_17975 [Parvularcula sp.]|nr:hypothetical protein [Parvularcula sp.]
MEEALKRFEGAEYYAAHHFLHLRYYLSGFGKNWINTEFCGFKLVSRPRISKWPDLAEKFGLAAEVWEHKSSETEKLAIFSAHYLGVIFETDKCSIQKLVNMSITDDVFPEYRPEDVIHDEF